MEIIINSMLSLVGVLFAATLVINTINHIKKNK